MKITMKHARACNYCVSGLREYFAKHNLDFKEFVKRGLDEEIIAKSNTEFSRRIIKVAHEENK